MIMTLISVQESSCQILLVFISIISSSTIFWAEFTVRKDVPHFEFRAINQSQSGDCTCSKTFTFIYPFEVLMRKLTSHFNLRRKQF